MFDRYEYPWREVAGSVVMSDLEKDRNAGEGEFKLAYRRPWDSGDAEREFTIRVRIVPK